MTARIDVCDTCGDDIDICPECGECLACDDHDDSCSDSDYYDADEEMS